MEEREEFETDEDVGVAVDLHGPLVSASAHLITHARRAAVVEEDVEFFDLLF